MKQQDISPPAIIKPADSLAELAARINAEHEAGESATRRGLEHYRACGEHLIKAKAACRHGEWLTWLKQNVRVSQQHAWRYMELAKLPTVSNLADAWRTITGRDEEPEPETPAGTCKPTQEERQAAADAYERRHGEPYPDAGAQPQAPPARETLPMADGADATPATGGKLGKNGEAVTLAAWKDLPALTRREYLSGGGEGKFNQQGDNPNIEWALWSWNPVTGCLHDCPYCYARDIANRFYETGFQPAIWPGRLAAPKNTTFPEAKAKEWMGHKNVFTCSMADLFGRWVPREWIDAVLQAVADAPQWNFLFLTKFPLRLSEFEFPDNAWVGTSVDCQVRVANAERAFRKVKARVKWLSIEPMIEPLTFTDLGAFQWVVLGGASASSQTPEWHPPREWVQSLEDEAARLGVAYYEKDNLHGRVRGYPGQPGREPTVAPEQLRYLPEVEKR